MTTRNVQSIIDTVWRMESAKIIGGLVRMMGDIDLAEDAAHDALVIALEQWPAKGIPDNPAAWLMSVAKRRAIDHLRRLQVLRRKRDELGRVMDVQEAWTVPEAGAALDEPIEDDLLRLMFICCHPILSREARVALTLRLLGGVSTDEIARAFLVPVPTVAQRIVRAKRKLREAAVPFAVPEGPERAERLSSVLEVIYLIFNEGYTATAGDRWFRPELCHEALRLGRILAQLMPQAGEVHGLLALMELQASRFRARIGTDGEPVLLMEQNRTLWDQLLIRRGLASLARAEALGDTLGPYTLQAAIAACHAEARSAEDTDWQGIAALYECLAQVLPSPVVELNRAVAVAMAYGPEAGLDLVDKLQDEPQMQNYHLLPSVRGDLLAKVGRSAEAQAEFQRAAALTANQRERRLLLDRAAAAACGEGGEQAVADYIVRARLKPERAEELQERLEEGAFDDMMPFGPGLADALERAHRDPETGEAVWEVRCYCNPPLAMERKAILDHYFDDITTEEVARGEGWKRIEDLPPLWEE